MVTDILSSHLFDPVNSEMFAIDKLAAFIAQRVNLHGSTVILIEIEEIFARFIASGTYG